MPAKLELSGRRFGRLQVVKEAGRSRDGRVLWLCTCDCGRETLARGSCLAHGRTTSCGCYRHDAVKTHGMKGTKAYAVWVDMIQRCTNPGNCNYERYGGRGITVCDEWKSSFSVFYADMGQPSPNQSIDRINVNGNYEKANCRWATKTQQSRNTRFQLNPNVGIRFLKSGRFVAHIKAGHKYHYLGTYMNIDDARNARRLGEIKYWGNPGTFDNRGAS